MSDKPRTDEREESTEVEQLTYKNEAKAAWRFARVLERELVEAKAENARLRVYNEQAEAAAAQHKSENARLQRVADLARDAVESGAVLECYLSLLNEALASLPKPDGFKRGGCVSQTISDGSTWMDKAGHLSFQAEIELPLKKDAK